MPYSSGLAALVVLAMPFLLGLVVTAKKGRGAGHELIGSVPPGWGALRWLYGTPLRLSSLKGKVVLVRWWTDACPNCRATIPALNQLRDEFADDGLVVIGMYHPKPPRPVSTDAVKEVAEEMGVAFRLAIDFDWGVLRKWWLSGGDRPFTSVTFLLDREGKIRLVQPGPVFSLEGKKRAVEDYQAIRTKVRSLLRAKPKKKKKK